MSTVLVVAVAAAVLALAWPRRRSIVRTYRGWDLVSVAGMRVAGASVAMIMGVGILLSLMKIDGDAIRTVCITGVVMFMAGTAVNVAGQIGRRRVHRLGIHPGTIAVGTFLASFAVWAAVLAGVAEVLSVNAGGIGGPAPETVAAAMPAYLLALFGIPGLVGLIVVIAGAVWAWRTYRRADYALPDLPAVGALTR